MSVTRTYKYFLLYCLSTGFEHKNINLLTFTSFWYTNIISWAVDNKVIDIMILGSFSAFYFSFFITELWFLAGNTFITTDFSTILSVVPILPLPDRGSTMDCRQQTCQDKNVLHQHDDNKVYLKTISILCGLNIMNLLSSK